MIKKYRRKQVIIDAIIWTGKNVYEVYSFIHGKPDNNSCRMAEDRWYDYEGTLKNKAWRLKTLESDNETQKADIGDYIIKGIKGEFYPCKPDIFPDIYEELKESENGE